MFSKTIRTLCFVTLSLSLFSIGGLGSFSNLYARGGDYHGMGDEGGMGNPERMSRDNDFGERNFENFNRGFNQDGFNRTYRPEAAVDPIYTGNGVGSDVNINYNDDNYSDTDPNWDDNDDNFENENF